MRNLPGVSARIAASRLLDLGVALVLASSLVVPVSLARAETGDPVLLNELLVSHTGDDTAEFVELYGTQGHSLAGLSLVVVEGDGAAAGSIDLRIDFAPEARLGGNGYFLVGNPAGLGARYGVVPDLAVTTSLPNGFMENGSQTVALVATQGLGAVGSVVTGSEDVRDAVGLIDGGLTETFFWNAPVVGPDDGFLPAGARRVADGVDTDTVEDWAFADDLLGAANTPTAASPFDATPSISCDPSLVTTEGSAASGAVTAMDPDGMVAGFNVASSPDPGTISLGAVSGSSAIGALATTTVEVGAATPSGSYELVVTAFTVAAPPQQASCTVTVIVEPAPEPPPPDPSGASVASLLSDLDRFVADSRLHPGKAELLRGHLERAARFLEQGRQAAAAAQLQAFANQARGFAPRWMDDAAADLLASAAAALGEQPVP